MVVIHYKGIFFKKKKKEKITKEKYPISLSILILSDASHSDEQKTIRLPYNHITLINLNYCNIQFSHEHIGEIFP